ncbi:two component regulator propeller family protein (macronuclear) [Tetrahymena thermophila SB210]|uniref:Two component regulator propeller family protein n=1 Tax=Tetrahymena thermophila (strain SB210) TaxID=312017 RepID=Q23A52_TETTS|nr:two component regulator propeller family protein [Tetrahymena thermophila SB210]EAR93428.2 two component regulator propeller family protein [Tetrahymena thermophila SB210]|eukprot:XP_001013673.2 two component regulator propeller family protein [Tetrahymena thermophila SB210]
MKVNLHIYLFFLVYIIEAVFAQSSIGFVYNSIPSYSFDVQAINGTSNRIKIAQQSGTAIAALGNAGIMIIDNKFNKYIHQSPDNSYIQTVQITKDGSYVILGMINQVGIFQLSQSDFSMKMISSINTQGQTIVDIQFNLEEDIMFVLGYLGVLQWFDVRNLKNIVNLGQIDYSANQILFVRGVISPDDRIFYINADFEGLLAFRIDRQTQNNQLQVNLVKILTKLAVTSFTELVVTSKNNYVFVIDRWNGIYILYDLSQLQLIGDDAEQNNNQKIQLVQFNLGSKIGYTSSLAKSLDDQFLYVGVRSLGILIYNINDPLNPQFFQQLQLSGQSFSLALSPKQNVIPNATFDNQYIYYLNSLSVAVFQKQKPSLYNNIPNLFNLQQSQLFQEGKAISKWRCTISQNSQYLLGAFDADGLCIFKIEVNSYTQTIPSKMQLVYQFNEQQEQIISTNTFRQFGPDEPIPLGFQIENIQFTKGEKHIYFTSQQSDKNVVAYKFQVNISPDGQYSFQYVKGLKYDQVYYSEQFNISEDEQHAVMSFDVGIALVDMVNFEVISMYTNQGVIGTCCGAVLSHDKKHALAVVRNVGLFIYDTSDMKNPNMVNQWRTNGGETLIRSKTDKIIYLIDGFNGLVLLDSTKLPDIVVLGKFVSSGWTNFISFTVDEKYGIISTMDTGTLTLIDLNNKSDLKIIMKSTIQQQDSLTTCIDKSGLQFLYSTNEKGLRLFNLQSQVLIHVERQVQSIDTQLYSLISDSDPFQVGLQYLVKFVLLYRKPNQIISQIYYYQDLVLQDLPSWIVVNRSNQSNTNLQAQIQLNIPKECLDSQNGTKSFLIIVIETCFQLSSTSFIYQNSDLITTPDESQIIFKNLKQSGYIDGTNCATNFFDSTSQQYLDLSQAFSGTNIDPIRLATIQLYVTETFKRTKVYNQFVFDVVSSLQFNQSQTQSMIQAVQNQLSVSFIFQDNSAYKFIQKSYPNLVMYFNDQLTVLKLEGELKYVNQALSNGILYYDQSKSKNITQNGSKTMQLQIVDNFNYNLNLDFDVQSQVKFLKIKQDIIHQKNIQDQVDRQGADLTIQQSFLIQFELDSFVDPDSIPLTYSFQQKISGQYLPISSDSFIKYDNVNLRLVGSPPSSYLFQKVYLRLEVSNGYTSTYEDFCLNINNMPFTYVFSILIQILGPIAFALGLYRKRSTFMNLYFKSDTMYSTEVVYVGQVYRKKISILDQDYEIANLFFEKFIKQANKSLNSMNKLQQGFNKSTKSIISQQNIKNEKQFPDSQKNIEINKNAEIAELDQLKTPKSNQFIEEQSIQDNKNTEKYIENQAGQNLASQIEGDNQNTLKNQNSNANQNSNKNETQEQQNEFKNRNSKQQSIFKKAFTQRSSFYLQQKQREKNYSINSQGIQSGIFKNYESKASLTTYFQIQAEDGTFQMGQLFNQMIENKLTVQYDLLEYKIVDYVVDLQDEKSRFYRCLKASVLRYLLQNEKKTFNFYQQLKDYSIKKGNYANIDWYRQYVSIIATNQTDKYGIPTPFSKTNLKIDEIFKVLKDLELIPQIDPNNQKLNYLQQIGINSNLLMEVLFADALGLDFVSAKNIVKCCGESIHLEKSKIISVEAFEKVQEGVCLSLRRLFNLQYKSMPISKYISLPSWMSYEFKNGVIILEGTPQKSDINDILVRIYDYTRFVCYQFHLKVEADPNMKSKESFPGSDDKEKQKNKDTDFMQTYQSPQQNPEQIQFNSSNQGYLNKQKHILEISIQNSQIQSYNQIKSESNDNQDQIEENNYQGIKSMSEYDLNLNQPPIFPHTPSYSRNKSPSILNANPNYQLNFPSILLTNQKNYLFERDEIKYAKSVLDQ